MSETTRVGITPKSWTAQRHYGVLHLGKRWYVVTADLDDAGAATGVRLDGPQTARQQRPRSRSSKARHRVGAAAATLVWVADIVYEARKQAHREQAAIRRR